MSQETFIVNAVRTAVGKAKRGTLRNFRPEELGAQVVRAAVAQAGNISGDQIDDVLIGCAMPEGEQGLNMGRIISQKAGLPDAVPAATINRFCSSGLQTIAMATQAIMAGHADAVVAGGAESMSMVPMSGYHYSPDPSINDSDPDLYLGMGLTAENVVAKYGISREDQDAFSASSHHKAAEAIEGGHFEQEIVPLSVSENVYDNGKVSTINREFKVDEGPRPDTTAEVLATLRPAFKNRGTVTAGNSSQMSDGAAAALIVSRDFLETHRLQPMAKLVGFSVAGVAPEIMGVGPVAAVPKVLKQTGLDLKDISLIELNEAFAAQALAVIRELGLDEKIVNISGGAIALGHPLGCTGAKLTATLLHNLRRKNLRYGMVTMCIGGGMGAAGIFENLMIS